MSRQGEHRLPIFHEDLEALHRRVPWMEGQVTRMSLDSSQDPQLPPPATSQGVSMDLGFRLG